MMFSGEKSIHNAPCVPLSILITCLELSVVTLLLRAPLTAILLVWVVAGAGSSAGLVGLVTVSAATSLGVGLALQRFMAQRRANAPSAQPSAPAVE